MYQLRRFYGPLNVNAIIDSLCGHITSYVNVIGSASLPFPEVCEMEGLPGTACRAEGHRQARLFPGTDPIDQAELLVEERTRYLFDLDDSYAVSGQPHSATQANHAVFRAVLGGLDGPVAALSPSDGGHISHQFGLPQGTEFVPIPLGSTGIDYDAFECDARRHRPVMIIGGGTSYTCVIDYPRLRAIADQCGAHLHADLAHTAPFVAVGRHPPAFPFCNSATLDTSKNLRGPRGGVLIYRKSDSSNMRRAIFPLLQSSPNQTGLMAKAACLSCWSKEELHSFAERMIDLANLLSDRVSRAIGPPVFAGTDTHLLLFDLSPMSLEGRAAETALEAARILVNRNQIPGDKRSPWITSGVRLGTTALACLGYTADDVRALGDAIVSVLSGTGDHTATIERLLGTYHRSLVNIANGPTSRAWM